MSLKPGAESASGGLKPTLLGLVAGALFALSAIGYRGAILSLHDPSFVMAATFTLAIGLADPVRAADGCLCAARPRRAGARSSAPGGRRCSPASWARSPRSSGFSASRIATAASVRTLALVEVLFAQAISRFVFKQPTSAREGLGIVLIVVGVVAAGVGLLMNQKPEVEYLRSNAVLPKNLPFSDGVRVGDFVIFPGSSGRSPDMIVDARPASSAEARQTLETPAVDAGGITVSRCAMWCACR